MLPTLALLSFQAVAPAPAALPFPGREVARGDDVVELAMDARSVRRLRSRERVVLTDVPWGAGLALELERARAHVEPGALHVDGRPRERTRRDTFWSGRVLGEPDTEAFLAFGDRATWGWVQRAGELVHVLSRPDAGGDWSAGATVLVSERALNERDLAFTPRCGVDQLPPPVDARSAPGGLPPAATAPGFAGLRLCRLALETDWQFFQLFGDVGVAEGYCLALFAAANLRFEKQANTRFVLPYLGFHTTPADPWTSQDQPGAICFDLLFEFQAAWQGGQAPVEADLHHFFSGVDLQCGVAFLSALCDPDEGFSVMSRMDGLTPFPVMPSPLNWDFVWMCHELGHNFGSVHTHEYCPPIDNCPAPPWQGPCQTQTGCPDAGTFMSYCHVCPDGLGTFNTWFHPRVARVLRRTVERSCFEPVPVTR